MFLTGHSKQAPGREERSRRAHVPSRSCRLGCRFSVWAHTQREPNYQWCSKRNIIASQRGISHSFCAGFSLLSLVCVSLWSFWSLSSLIVILPLRFLFYISIHLLLISLSASSPFIPPCLVSFHHPVALFIFRFLIFPLLSWASSSITWQRGFRSLRPLSAHVSFARSDTCPLFSSKVPRVVLIGS